MASNACNEEKATSMMYLNIRNGNDQLQFLKEVQPDFLKVVDPVKSDLLDILYSAEKVLTRSDVESLSGKDNTRKEQARKLWFLLNKMSVKAFVREVSPVLVKEFPHIIPAKFLTQEKIDVTSVTDDVNYCLHHDIRKRIRLATFADLLFQHGCLDLQEYEDLVSKVKDADYVWRRLFQSCGQAEDMAKLQEGVRGLLDTRGMHVPHSLRRLLTSGLPCTCDAGAEPALPASPSPSAASSLQRNKVKSWVMKSPLGRNSPTSRDSPTSSCASSSSTLEQQSRRGSSGSSGGHSYIYFLGTGDLAAGAEAGNSTSTLSPIGEEGVIMSEPSPLTSPPPAPGNKDAQPTPDNAGNVMRTHDINEGKMESLRIHGEEDGGGHYSTGGMVGLSKGPQMGQPGTTGTGHGAPGRSRRQMRQMSSPMGEASGSDPTGKPPVRFRGLDPRGYKTL